VITKSIGDKILEVKKDKTILECFHNAINTILQHPSHRRIYIQKLYEN